jgi:hypothetical protein
MRLFFFLLLFLVAHASVRAQNSFSNTGSGLLDMSSYMHDDDSLETDELDELDREDATPAGDPLASATMDATDSLASFDNLPEKVRVMAHLTDADGTELSIKSITSEKNTMNLKSVSAGLYYVTLTYKKYRKAFPLERAEKAPAGKKKGAAQPQ